MNMEGSPKPPPGPAISKVVTTTLLTQNSFLKLWLSHHPHFPMTSAGSLQPTFMSNTPPLFLTTPPPSSTASFNSLLSTPG